VTEDGRKDQTDDDVRVPRIDPAHGARAEHRDHVPSFKTDSDPAQPTHALLTAQMQQQAAELGRHLRSRQTELARWEAELNARSAAWEDEQRSTRLWLQEKQVEFDQKASWLAHTEQQLAQRADELEATYGTAQSLVARERELEQREQQVQVAEARLAQELDQAKRKSSALDEAQQSWTRQRYEEQAALDALDQQLRNETRTTIELNAKLSHQIQETKLAAQERQRLSDRWQDLERIDAAMAQQRVELDRERELLAHEREQRHDRTQRQRNAIADRLAQQRHAIQTEAAALEQAGRDLEQRREVLAQLQRRIGQRQREVIETCVILEHLWQALENRTAPQQLAEISARVRQQVAEDLADRERLLAEKEAEIQDLVKTLSRQTQALGQHSPNYS
jgi:hypothetical protein